MLLRGVIEHLCPDLVVPRHRTAAIEGAGAQAHGSKSQASYWLCSYRYTPESKRQGLSLNFIDLHWTSLNSIELHWISFAFTELQWLHCTSLSFIELDWTWLNPTELYSTSLSHLLSNENTPVNVKTSFVHVIVSPKHCKYNTSGSYPNVFVCFHSMTVERKQNRGWTILRCLGNYNVKTQQRLHHFQMLTTSNVLELYLSTISCRFVKMSRNHRKRKANRNCPNAVFVSVSFKTRRIQRVCQNGDSGSRISYK